MIETSFYLIFSFALVAFASIRLARIAPWLNKLADRKPLGCNVCISFWTVLILALSFYKWTNELVITVLSAAPAVGLSIILLDLVDYLIPRGKLPLPEENGGTVHDKYDYGQDGNAD